MLFFSSMERMQEGRGKLSFKSLRKLDYASQHPAGLECWRGSCVAVDKVPQGLSLKAAQLPAKVSGYCLNEM